MTGQWSVCDESQHEFEGSAYRNLPLGEIATTEPQQVGTESSQRVGIRHAGQLDGRRDGPAHIRVSKMDIAMPAWLLGDPSGSYAGRPAAPARAPQA